MNSSLYCTSLMNAAYGGPCNAQINCAKYLFVAGSLVKMLEPDVILSVNKPNLLQS